MPDDRFLFLLLHNSPSFTFVQHVTTTSRSAQRFHILAVSNCGVVRSIIKGMAFSLFIIHDQRNVFLLIKYTTL